MTLIPENDSSSDLPGLQKGIMMAVQSAAAIMAMQGVNRKDIAKSFIAFGAALMQDTLGTTETANILRSAADTICSDRRVD